MMTQTLQTHGLPDDFANRIGRLIEARGSMVDALFDPAAMPDLLAELEVCFPTKPGGAVSSFKSCNAAAAVSSCAASRPRRSMRLLRGSTVAKQRTPYTHAVQCSRVRAHGLRSLTERTPAAPTRRRDCSRPASR